MFQPGANLYGIGFSTHVENVEVPTIQTRPPTVNDVVNFPLGKVWIDTVGNNSYTLTSMSSIGGTLQASWSSGGNGPATASTQGIVQLATLSQLQNGNAPAGPFVSLTNDIATVIAGIVVGAVPPATTAQAGIVTLATNA